MIQLHYYPSNASMAPHILLEELGVPFELVVVDRTRDMHKSADYLRLNPNGLIPVLVHGELVMYETAAICLHLADVHPALELVPPLGGAQRAHFYKWLLWLSNTLHATLILYFYPERWTTPGHAQSASGMKAQAEARVGPMLDQLEDELVRQGGPWFLGERYTALDPYVLMLCRWTRGFGQPARDRACLGRYLQRMLERPAVRRAFATEKLAEPWV